MYYNHPSDLDNDWQTEIQSESCTFLHCKSLPLRQRFLSWAKVSCYFALPWFHVLFPKNDQHCSITHKSKWILLTLYNRKHPDFCLWPKSVNTSAKNFHFQVWLVGIRITWSLLLNAKLTSTSGKKWLVKLHFPSVTFMNIICNAQHFHKTAARSKWQNSNGILRADLFYGIEGSLKKMTKIFVSRWIRASSYVISPIACVSLAMCYTSWVLDRMVWAYKKNIIASKKTEYKRSLTCIIIIHRIWITTGRLRPSQNLVLFSIVNLYHRGSHSCLERRSLVILPCPYFMYYFLKMISIVPLLTNQNEFYWLFTIESTPISVYDLKVWIPQLRTFISRCDWWE